MGEAVNRHVDLDHAVWFNVYGQLMSVCAGYGCGGVKRGNELHTAVAGGAMDGVRGPIQPLERLVLHEVVPDGLEGSCARFA